MIRVEKIQLADVLKYDKEKFNTNNHWPNNKKPADYDAVLEKSSTQYWIDQFRDNYQVINIGRSELRWMQKASLVGQINGRFSSLFEDDLDELLRKYKHLNKLFENKESYFVRTDRFSLKYGQHGLVPYSSVKTIIESSVTSKTGHNPIDFHHADAPLKFYLLPWLNLDPDLEFRIFVYKQKIVAISQQHLYSVNQTLCKYSDNQITKMVSEICTFFNDHIKSKIKHVDSYVLDLGFCKDKNEWVFIEINSFGKEYSSGSALFHWILDEKCLYNESTNEVVFRVVSD